MRIGTATVVVGMVLALAGCSGGHAKPHAADTIVTDDSAITPASDDTSPTPSPTDSPDADDTIVKPPVAPPKCPGGGPYVHFDTPEAAMTYLAAAWNHNDLAALCKVSNPNARFELEQMHREAVNLRLVSCMSIAPGSYTCKFRHDYPAHMHKSGTGHAVFDVGAADNPGYYMTVFEGCG